jgi:hypothetical protein
LHAITLAGPFPLLLDDLAPGVSRRSLDLLAQLLLGATDRVIGLVSRFAACFTDGRDAGLVEHRVETMVAQRVFGIALGYEDLVDHDQLRHDPVLATLVGKLRARRRGCARSYKPTGRPFGASRVTRPG